MLRKTSVQKNVVNALMEPAAYDEEPGKIKLVQTHISFVFLTRKFAYKIKKAVDLGFLDFTTLEKRRFFCEKELKLNRRLCRDMYLEVVPINRSTVFKIKGEGETVEYAVKMKRMPQAKMMNQLLKGNKIDDKIINRLAKIIADFHSKIGTSREIGKFGSLAVIRTNWIENFEQTQSFIGKTISKKDFEQVRERVNNFMKEQKTLFENRVTEGRVRDCHGDIHSGNIFIVDGIHIFDAIEFNERFRYSDVASDVAFLAMDLDYKGRVDLSKLFIKKYVTHSGDEELMKLLPFYKCYRAYVRGKVTSFKLEDPNISEEEKKMATQEAKTYFKLATTYSTTI